MTEETQSTQNPLSGITKYWQVIAGILVAALAVGQYIEKQKDFEVDNSNRDSKNEIHFNSLETKIQKIDEQVYRELEQRVDDLEEWKAYEDGYKQAIKDMKNDKP